MVPCWPLVKHRKRQRKPSIFALYADGSRRSRDTTGRREKLNRTIFLRQSEPTGKRSITRGSRSLARLTISHGQRGITMPDTVSSSSETDEAF